MHKPPFLTFWGDPFDEPSTLRDMMSNGAVHPEDEPYTFLIHTGANHPNCEKTRLDKQDHGGGGWGGVQLVKG